MDSPGAPWISVSKNCDQLVMKTPRDWRGYTNSTLAICNLSMKCENISPAQPLARGRSEPRGRPTMRFVQIKSPEQQGRLMQHRAFRYFAYGASIAKRRGRRCSTSGVHRNLQVIKPRCPSCEMPRGTP